MVSDAGDSVGERIDTLVERLAAALTAQRWSLVSAESCTGGLIAAACTSLAGSSAWFDRGLVTYSNDAKTALLDVPPASIALHGAVSAEVACAMAAGALARSSAQLAVAVTGIAGPAGAVAGKPVGTVWIATASVHAPPHAVLHHFGGDRAAVRRQAVVAALRLAIVCVPGV